MRRYHIQDREDYHKFVHPLSSPLPILVKLLTNILHRYNRLCGSMRALAHRLALLPAQDPFRARMESQVLSKLYDMGVLNLESKLSDVENKLTVAAFCRRRLGVVMTRLKMAETVSTVRLFIISVLVRKTFIQRDSFVR